MALAKFLTKQSTTTPVITDFYNRMLGSFGSFFPVEYIPNSAEYSIIETTANVWELRIETSIISSLRELHASNKSLIDVEFSTFPQLLSIIDIKGNFLPAARLDSLIQYFANANDLGEFLFNVLFNTSGNSEIRTSASNADHAILLSRGWLIEEDTTTPAPSPTPTVTPTPTKAAVYLECNDTISQIFTGTKSYTVRVNPNAVSVSIHYEAYTNPDRFTISQNGTSVTTGFVGSSTYNQQLTSLGYPAVSGPGKGTLTFNLLNSRDPVILTTESPIQGAALEFIVECVSIPTVQTLAGAGTAADFVGKVTDSYCNLNLFPTPTLTPSPTNFIGPRVFTIGGTGKYADHDGSSCIAVAQKPTVITLAGSCNISSLQETPTPTPTLRAIRASRSQVYTIGGRQRGGLQGDMEGIEIGVDPFPTPTPTTTPAALLNGGASGSTADPADIPLTPTPTPSVTATTTSTPTVTPTLSLTPSVTPTLSPIRDCVLPKVKTDEACCPEPAVAQGHGSTTFNSRITSYVKLLNRCKSALGYPLIQLEVTDEQIYNFIDISLEFFTKFGGYTEEYLIFKSTLYKRGIGLPIGDLFSITPELANSLDPLCPSGLNTGIGQDIDMDDRRKVMDVFTVQPGDNSGINTLFTIEQTIAQQAYFGHLLGNVGFDLVTFDVLKMWLKTREKVLALKPSYRFYPERQVLRITPEPIQSTPYFGIIGAYVQKPIRELISQLWIYKYTVAQMKIAMGHVRGKYAGTGLYGGQTVNYTDLMSQGIKEMDELEKELKTDLIDREPIPFFLG